eukprot:120769_1
MNIYNQISTNKITIISITIFWLMTCIGVSTYIRLMKNNTTIENDNQKIKHKMLDINKIILESSTESHSSNGEQNKISDKITVNNQKYEGVKSTKLQPIPEANIIDCDIMVTLLSNDESESIHHI